MALAPDGTAVAMVRRRRQGTDGRLDDLAHRRTVEALRTRPVCDGHDLQPPVPRLFSGWPAHSPVLDDRARQRVVAVAVPGEFRRSAPAGAGQSGELHRHDRHQLDARQPARGDAVAARARRGEPAVAGRPPVRRTACDHQRHPLDLSRSGLAGRQEDDRLGGRRQLDPRTGRPADGGREDADHGRAQFTDARLGGRRATTGVRQRSQRRPGDLAAWRRLGGSAGRHLPRFSAGHDSVVHGTRALAEGRPCHLHSGRARARRRRVGGASVDFLDRRRHAGAAHERHAGVRDWRRVVARRQLVRLYGREGRKAPSDEGEDVRSIDTGGPQRRCRPVHPVVVTRGDLDHIHGDERRRPCHLAGRQDRSPARPMAHPRLGVLGR